MELHEKIKSLRIERSMTQRYVGNQLGVSEVSVRCWENGSKIPSTNAVVLLANLFNVTTDYLLGVNVKDNGNILLDKQEKKLLSNYRALDKYGKKVVDSICAIEKERIENEKHQPKIALLQHDKKVATRQIPRYYLPSAAGISAPIDNDDFELITIGSDVPSDADFAVRIQGESMYPYINDGDTVFVKRNCDLKIGDVGIFSVDGAMYCKQYYIDEERNLTLVSANPKLEHTNVYISADSTSSVKCYGKVLLDHKIKLPDYFTSET